MNDQSNTKQAEKANILEANTLKQLLKDDLEYSNLDSSNFLEQLDHHQDSNSPINLKDGTIIQSRLIEWLCRNSKTHKILSRKQGVRIENATFEGKLNLDYIDIDFPLEFKDCTFKNTLSLRHAWIRSLSLEKSTFKLNTQEDAITADGIKVKGAIYLNNGFSANRQVRLLGAVVEDVLQCSGGSFIDEEKAINATRIKVLGDVFLGLSEEGQKFNALGKINFMGAEIAGQLNCYQAISNKPKKVSFIIDRANINGGVSLKGAEIKGEIRLIGTTIGNILDCRGAKFTYHATNIYELSNRFCWCKKLSLLLGCLWIREEKRNISTLNLDGSHIKGNVYLLNDIENNSEFVSQGEVKMKGTTVDGVVYGGISIWRKLWQLFLHYSIDYGNKPWLSLIWSLAIIGVMGVFYHLNEDLIREPQEVTNHYTPESITFNPYIYSADVFLPIIDFQQESFWEIDPTDNGKYVRYLYWIEVGSGWVFSTITVAAFSGAIRSRGA